MCFLHQQFQCHLLLDPQLCLLTFEAANITDILLHAFKFHFKRAKILQDYCFSFIVRQSNLVLHLSTIFLKNITRKQSPSVFRILKPWLSNQTLGKGTQHVENMRTCRLFDRFWSPKYFKQRSFLRRFSFKMSSIAEIGKMWLKLGSFSPKLIIKWVGRQILAIKMSRKRPSTSRLKIV